MNNPEIQNKELQEEVIKLKNQIKKIKEKKKYGLVWEEEKEPERIVLDCRYKVPILKEVKSKEILTDKHKPINILIEGDNFHALSVLSYTHKGKIDVIYIDPPYNTGNKSWKYNNHYVELDDSYKHSFWLSFMDKRLRLARSLLKKDGIICVTIDDHELPKLWMLLEEIFGEDNHLGTVVIRNNPKGRKTERKVSLVHEYALFFGKSDSASIKKIPIEIEEKSHKYIKDKDGSWYLPVNLRKQGVDSLAVNSKGKIADRWYPIYCDPKTGKVCTKEKLKIKIMPIDPSGQKRIWRRGKEVIDEMYLNGELWCKETRHGLQIYFKFRGGLDGEPPESIWNESKYSASEYGTKILENILSKREAFPYPKSPFAVQECIRVCNLSKSAIILDFFAGSGTTLQAVLELNSSDDGSRQCILVTNDENGIASEICYPRVRNVISGYKTLKGERIKGLDGNLKYYKSEVLEIDHVSHISDEQRIKLTYQAGEMIALRENTFEGVEKNEWYQIFKNGEKYTAIYFKENKSKLNELVKKLLKYKHNVALYIFSWGKNEYKNEFSEYENIRIEDIPEPIIEVYKEINRL